MIKGALIGYPTIQSISHITHNSVFKELRVPAQYTKIDIKKKDLEKSIKELKEQNYRWFAVTMPLKQAVVPYLDYLRENAHVLKTVNTILVEDGKWVGECCDGIGCINAIEKKLPVKGKRVLVVGAGGTAKAIAYEAKKRGAKVFVWNRTQIRAESLCIDLKVECLYELKGSYDIVINATCVGMNSNELSVPIGLLCNASLVMDVVYIPLETTLLRTAKSIGCEIVTGLEMFLELSAIQIEWAFGNNISRREVIEIMEKSISMHFFS